jgi:hypothetical protein
LMATSGKQGDLFTRSSCVSRCETEHNVLAREKTTNYIHRRATKLISNIVVKASFEWCQPAQ